MWKNICVFTYSVWSTDNLSDKKYRNIARTLIDWNLSIKSDLRFIFRCLWARFLSSSVSFLLFGIMVFSPMPYMYSFSRCFSLNCMFVSRKVNFLPALSVCCQYLLFPRIVNNMVSCVLRLLQSPYLFNFPPFLAQFRVQSVAVTVSFTLPRVIFFELDNVL